MNAVTTRAASASGASWKAIADQCLAELGTAGPPASLGLLYVTEQLAPELSGLLAYLRRQTGIDDWIGSVGCGICTSGHEIYDETAAAIMLASLPPDSFRILPAGLDPMAEMVATSHHWIAEHGVHFGIVHGDPRNSHIPQIIESLSAELDPGFLVGGLSSANDAMYQLQIAGEPCHDGLSGVLLSAAVPVITGLTQGCTPLKRRHTITRCERNILVELDGRPALEVFREDIGEVLSKDLSKVAGYIFAGLPVPGSDTGDYLVRNLVGIDPEQNLVAIGDYIEEDDTIMFCRRDGDTAREDMLRMLRGLKERVPGEIRGGLYYSCLGRGRYQFGDDSEELRMISDELGEFPLVGFFANGEISHNRLYGYTGVLTLFV